MKKGSFILALKKFAPLIAIVGFLLTAAMCDRALYVKGEYDGYDNFRCRTFVDFNLDVLMENKKTKRITATGDMLVLENPAAGDQCYMMFLPFAAATSEGGIEGVAMFYNFVYIGDYKGIRYYDEFYDELTEAYDAYTDYDYKLVNRYYCNRYIKYQ